MGPGRGAKGRSPRMLRGFSIFRLKWRVHGHPPPWLLGLSLLQTNDRQVNNCDIRIDQDMSTLIYIYIYIPEYPNL